MCYQSQGHNLFRVSLMVIVLRTPFKFPIIWGLLVWERFWIFSLTIMLKENLYLCVYKFLWNSCFFNMSNFDRYLLSIDIIGKRNIEKHGYSFFRNRMPLFIELSLFIFYYLFPGPNRVLFVVYFFNTRLGLVPSFDNIITKRHPRK